MAIKTNNMIFVFGSNLGGIHGAGAARYAAEHRGAKYGVGYGRTGQSYAIPTKGMTKGGGIGGTLPLVTINRFVTDFLAYARAADRFQFQVTCIGCGLAGLKHEDIAPMFVEAPSNCWFDSAWQGIFDREFYGKINNYWGTF